MQQKQTRRGSSKSSSQRAQGTGKETKREGNKEEERATAEGGSNTRGKEISRKGIGSNDRRNRSR